MDSGDVAQVILSSLIPTAPYLAAWIVAIVFSAIMLRRGGGRAERFLLTGSCLMLASTLFRSVASAVIQVLFIQKGWDALRVATVLSYNGLFFGLVSLAGIVCLVYAFWIKFKVKSGEYS